MICQLVKDAIPANESKLRISRSNLINVVSSIKTNSAGRTSRTLQYMQTSFLDPIKINVPSCVPKKFDKFFLTLNILKTFTYLNHRYNVL